MFIWLPAHPDLWIQNGKFSPVYKYIHARASLCVTHTGVWEEERDMRERMRKPKAIIVGGSIAGISCAKALILAGWDVVVIEKTCGPPTGNPTGAGIALHPLSQKIVKSWLHQPDLLHNITLPLTIDQVMYVSTQNCFNFNWRSHKLCWFFFYFSFCEESGSRSGKEPVGY